MVVKRILFESLDDHLADGWQLKSMNGSSACDGAVRECVVEKHEDPLVWGPFFSYFGGKWPIARHYPPPMHSTIVEPFAGAAGYSTLHHRRRVILIERDPRIAAIWRFLIAARREEIERIPLLRVDQTTDDLGAVSEEARDVVGLWVAQGKSVPVKGARGSRHSAKFLRQIDDSEKIPRAARDLVGFWVNRGSAIPKKSAGQYQKHFVEDTGYIFSWSLRERLARQVEEIKHWTIIEASCYEQDPVPNREATWFIDPPYQKEGKEYRYGTERLCFPLLARWCKERRGQVMVCESDGADWLPFKPILEKKREVLWYKRDDERRDGDGEGEHHQLRLERGGREDEVFERGSPAAPEGRGADDDGQGPG